MNQFALYTAPGGALIADYSSRVQGLTIATNGRGYAECSCFVPLAIAEAFQLYDRAGLPHVLFNDASSGAAYEGRLEDVNIVDGGVNLRAFGYSRSLSDMPYTALWSSADVTQWHVLTAANVSGTAADKHNFDQNNRLYFSLKKNAVYTTGTDFAIFGFRIPDGSSRNIIGISFDMVVFLPSGWNFVLQTRASDWSGGTNIDVITGITGPYNKYYTFTGAAAVDVVFYNNSGSNYTNTNEDGFWSLAITNVRVVTATTNAVNTTMTSAVSSGSNVSVPVGSSARMYVGQRLHLGIPAAIGEGVTVKSIPDATHFVADLTAGYSSGSNVQAFVIYADEIAKDLIATTNALNSLQLASSTALVQSPALDLFNESYEDTYGADVLDYLVRLGDSQATPRQWEWGVLASRLLYFRPQGSAARTWYVDVSALDVQRSINDLWNSVYANYQEAGGRTLRTAANTDTTSPTRYGVTRRKMLTARTTSSVQATAQRDAALADGKDPRPRSGLTISRVYDASGQRWPLWQVAAGDTMIIRNLPPTLSVAIDRIRVFRLTRAEYHADDDTLVLEPESPLPSLDAMLARVLPPVWVTSPWWVQLYGLSGG